MALVSYEFSGSEDEDEPQVSPPKVATAERISKPGMFSQLPKPKGSCITHSLNKVEIKTKAGDLAKKGPVKIFAPALGPATEHDEDEVPVKKFKTTQKSSDLFALLPPPKSSVANSNVLLVPQIVKKAPKPKPVVSATESDEEFEPGDLSGVGSFFGDGLNSDLKGSESSKAKGKLVVNATDIKDNHYFSTLFAKTKKEQQPVVLDEKAEWDQLPLPNSEEEKKLKEQELEENAVKELCGKQASKSASKSASSKIKFIDVNASDFNSEAMINVNKSLTDPFQQANPITDKDGPGSMHKRKHQITYLAHQAKVNEQELQNQWAQNRFTRKQTQSKYGF